MKTAIIIMAKVPRAGNVKTRLQPRLTPEQSADFAACLLFDTIEKVKSLGNELIIAYTPPNELEYFNRFSLAKETLFSEQKGIDLGEKIFNAFEFAFRWEADSAVMIGTDSPTFPIEFIENALTDLKTYDAVLGKTSDGGFYLIGLSRLKTEIFENVEWSSTKTFRQTKENILRAGFRLKEIPGWYDVDEPPDLEKLRRDFEQNEISRLIAPKTFEWLRRIYRKRTATTFDGL
jgi:rSAM/selenodomain-associated transferase 1